MGAEILSVFILVLALILLIAYWQRSKKRLIAAKLSSQQTLLNCTRLLGLTRHLQQHRGMSSAWLSGDQNFASRREGKTKEILALLPGLSELVNQESLQNCPCITVNEWVLFRHHWKELLEALPKLSVEQSIARHSQLINKVLEWLAAIGEARIEPLASEREMVGAARNYAHRLPLLTECLGQARAIGSSVTAQHSCPPVARVRLLFLISRAEALLEQAVAAHGSGVMTSRSQQAIKEMVATVRTRMLFSSGVVVKSEEYFEMSTKAIDLVFEWIGACERSTQCFMEGVSVKELHPC
ncbi:MAG: hypothetical protein RIR18_1955 [Pseudomonadota bacterium]|jgi:hypothetical protein